MTTRRGWRWHGRGAVSSGHGGEVAPVDEGSDYDAFISYSHAWDRDLAKAFQSALQSFDRPWYRPRGLKLFRDESNLAASPHLWREIEEGLARSRWLVVMASPQAAASPWVSQEIRWWLTHRSAETLLIGWTDGALVWDPALAGFDWSLTDSLPQAEMAQAFGSEPRWVDLRWLRDPVQAGSADPRLIECVAEFVAPLTGRSKDELIGDHVRRRRQTRRLVRATVSVLTVLLLLAIGGGVTAYTQRNSARAQTLVAQSRQLVAEAASIRDTQPNLARQLMVQAYRLAPTAEAMGALVESQAIPRVVHGRGPVHTAAYSSRGLLALADTRGVQLLEPARGTVPVATKDLEHQVTAAAFSSDGRLLALGDSVGGVRLLDVSDHGTPKVVGQVSSAAGREEILGLALASAGRLFALTGEEGAVIDVSDPARPRRLTPLPDHPVAVSTRGDLVLAEDREKGLGRLRLWNVSGFSRPRPLAALPSEPQNYISEAPQRAAFSSDGHLLAVAGKDSQVRLWDVTDPARPIARPKLIGQSRGGHYSVEFSPDATILAAGDSDGTVDLWDVSDPLRPRAGDRLSGRQTTVGILSFSPDGNSLASVGGESPLGPSSDDTLRLWTVAGSQRTSASVSLPTEGSFPAAFGPDSRLLAAGGYPTSVWRVHGTGPPRQLATVETVNLRGQAAAFGRDGRTLFSGVPLKVWDMTDPANPRDLTRGVARAEGASSLAVNPVLPLVAVQGGPGDPAEVWDVGDRTRPVLLGTLAGTPAQASQEAVAFSPDGTLLAAPAGKAVRLWRVGRSSRPEPIGEVTTRSQIGHLAFMPTGRTLLVGDETGAISTWDVTDPGEPERQGSSARHTGAILGLAVHPDGELAASSGWDSRIRLWDIRNLARPVEVTALSTNSLYPRSGLAFSPDGRLLAASGLDDTLLWSVHLTSILQRLCTESQPLTREQWAQYLPDRPYDPPCA